MNALYYIAILEGFLGQHQQLPQNVIDAIAFLKRATTPTQDVPAVKKKKKRRMTPEQKEKMRAALAKYRAENGLFITDAIKTQILELKRQGKSAKEIMAATGKSKSTVDRVIYAK